MRTTCPRANCGVALVPVRFAEGRIWTACPACSRNKAGRCRDCPAALTSPRSMRCLVCAARQRRSLGLVRDRARYPKRRKQVLAALRRKRRNRVYREHKRRYMAAYRAAHQRDALDRAYGRAYMAMRRADAGYRDRQNARKRELHALQRQQRQAA